jgi:hypothetical protein
MKAADKVIKKIFSMSIYLLNKYSMVFGNCFRNYLSLKSVR